ncbi:hypothetical protein, partial [Candidatus Entotheonella palauensis]
KGGYIMRRWSSILIAFCLAGAMAAPAAAVDVGEFLSITGFIDNHVRYVDNLSSAEEAGRGNLSLDDDDQWNGRTRGRIFFNVKPNAFSQGVVGFEFDQVWGDDGDGGGFDLGNDNNAFELKHLYVDLKIPTTPIRMQVGGFSVNATSLKRCIVFCDDAGGIAVHGDWSPNFSTYTWFIVAEEELIEDGPDDVGEDFTIGTNFKVKVAKGIDIHFMAAYYGIDGPSSDSSSLMIGSCSGSREGGDGRADVDLNGDGDTNDAGETLVGNHCFDKDERYYFGIDAQLKFGAFTLKPSFIYMGGQRDLVNGGEVDLQSFLLDLRGKYSAGPLSVEGKFVYIPGNEANDPLDGSDDDLKYWQNISVTTVNRTVNWFELMGFNIDSTSAPSFGFNNSRAMRSAGTFDQFGLIHPAVKVDYNISKPLTLSAAVGAFLSAEDTGVPARFIDEIPATYNWKGGNNYLGTEFDVVLTYRWFKGATVNVWFAYAATGEAQDLCAPGTGGRTQTPCDEQEAEDRVGFGARMIYRF